MSTLGERLQIVMQELKISNKKELADLCGVSSGLVTQWFSGDTDLGPKPLVALSKFHFNLDWLANGNPPMYRAEYAGPRPVESVESPSPPPIDPGEIVDFISLFAHSSKTARGQAIRLLRRLRKESAVLPGTSQASEQ